MLAVVCAVSLGCGGTSSNGELDKTPAPVTTASSYAPPDVKEQFEGLKHHGEALGWTLPESSGAPDPSVSDHYQGVARYPGDGVPVFYISQLDDDDHDPGGGTTGGYLHVARMGSRGLDGERLRSNLLAYDGVNTKDTAPPASDTWLRSIRFNGIDVSIDGEILAAYNHAGGFAIADDILFMALDQPQNDPGAAPGLIILFDLGTNGENRENPDPIQALTLTHGIDNLAVTALENGRYLIWTNGSGGEDTRFYRTNADADGVAIGLRDDRLALDHVQLWTPVEPFLLPASSLWPTGTHAHQSSTFVRQGNGPPDPEDPLFMISMWSTVPAIGIPGLFTWDIADLFRVKAVAADENLANASEYKLGLVSRLHMYCNFDGSGRICHFGAGSSAYVSPSGELILYSVPHDDQDGFDPDFVRMAEFRHREVIAPANQRAVSADAGGPYELPEGGSIDLAGAGSAASRPIWVEIYDDNNGWKNSIELPPPATLDRSIVIDYQDRNLQELINFNYLDGFNDKASSVCWRLPVGMNFVMFDDDNFADRWVMLIGTDDTHCVDDLGSSVVRSGIIAARGKEQGQTLDFNDKTSSVGFFGVPPPDESSVNLAWDLDGDGVFDDGFGESAVFDTSAIDGPGSVDISLRVCADDGSRCRYDSTTVSVHNAAPAVDAGPDRAVDKGDTVNFNGSYSDPGTQDTHDIEWDFGDGSPTAGGTLEPSHVYVNDGVYTVTLTVTDDDGGVGEDSVQVMVRDTGTEPPEPPIGDLFARAKDGKINLVWTPVPTASGYNIYRSTVPGGAYYTLIAGDHQCDYCAYKDDGLTNGTTYYYLVTWISDGVESEFPIEVSATPRARRSPGIDPATDSWMGTLQAAIGPRKLREVVIPGTHDTGTYAISGNSSLAPDCEINSPDFICSFSQLFWRWSKAQGNPVLQQLNDGIRYLDIRICYDSLSDSLRICHGLWGAELDEVLDDVHTFINQPGHEKEILILDFQHFYAMDNAQHEALVEDLRSLFGSKLVPSSAGVDVTVNEIWDAGQQIIVLYGNDKTENLCQNDEARSLTLQNLQAGRVLRLYDSPGNDEGDDWIKITAKQSFEPGEIVTVSSLEQSASLAKVEVEYFPDNGLNGKVSSLIVDHDDAFTMSDDVTELVSLYSGGAGTGNLLCTIHLDETRTLSFPAEHGVFLPEVALDTKNDFLWIRDNVIRSEWANAQDLGGLNSVLNGELPNDTGLFHVLQGMLSPDASMIIDDIFEEVSLEKLADDSNPWLERWVGRPWSNDNLNIVIVDFYENSNIVELAIFLNSHTVDETATIDLYEGNGQPHDPVCRVSLQSGLQLVFPDNDDCGNDEAKMLVLRNVGAGTELRLFDSPDGSTDDDWVEIIVKRDLDSKIIESFESFVQDDDIHVISHHRNGLDGKVSRLQVVNLATLASGATATADLFKGDHDFQDLACTLRATAGASLTLGGFFSRCHNDEARSMVLYDLTAGQAVRAYDSPDADTQDDWLEIEVKRNIDDYTLPSLELYFNEGYHEDDNVRIHYHRNNGLNGKLSYIEVDTSTTGATIDLYEGNNATQNLLCSIEANGNVDQSLASIPGCDNDEARSLALHDVPAGRVIKLYDSPEQSTQDDWIEIIALRDINFRIIDTLEESFSDDAVRVVYHRNNGLDGKVSAIDVSDTPSGAHVVLYEGNDVTQNIVCTVFIAADVAIDFTDNADCDNDEARSMMLYDVPAGRVIRLYDSANGSQSDDWVQIKAKDHIAAAAVNSFETAVDNDLVEVITVPNNGLDGKVSRLEADDVDVIAGMPSQLIFKEGNFGTQDTVCVIDVANSPGARFYNLGSLCGSNDEARSLILTNVPNGLVVTVHDRSDCGTSDDYSVITVHADNVIRFTVNSFEFNITEGAVRQSYFSDNGLDGKVSCVVVLSP